MVNSGNYILGMLSWTMLEEVTSESPEPREKERLRGLVKGCILGAGDLGTGFTGLSLKRGWAGAGGLYLFVCSGPLSYSKSWFPMDYKRSQFC